MHEVTSGYLEKMEENSCLFSGGRSGVSEVNRNGRESSSSKDNVGAGTIVPRFDPNEVSLEGTIGMGEFGVVLRVGTISLSPRSNHYSVPDRENIGNEKETIEYQHNKNVETNRLLREELARPLWQRQSHHSTATTASTLSSSDDKHSDSSLVSQDSAIELAPVSNSDVPANTLLVIKQIRKDLYPKKRIEAAKDLAREAKLLSRLQQLYFLENQFSESSQRLPYCHPNNTTNRNNHPNLITLRGTVSDPGSPYFGILLDRLHLTLAELSSSWKNRQRHILETLSNSRSRRHKLLITPPDWWVPPDQIIGALTLKVEGLIHGEDHKRQEHHPGLRMRVSKSAEELGRGKAPATTTMAIPPEAMLLLGERILALWDVSEGMGHLHSHKILYRDLKTENVGRTVRSKAEGENPRSILPQNFDHREQQRMQIFDFGLAKECKPSDRILLSPKTSTATLDGGVLCADSEDAGSFYDDYQMTGMTGTMRIMAPEVIKCIPYGLPADVYSFGICMWEIFTGTKCNFLSAAEICDTKRTVRPQLPRVFDAESCCVGMPRKLQALMQACWHEDPKKRPSFPEISRTLRSALAGVHQQSLRPEHHRQQRFRFELQRQQRNLSALFAKGMEGRRSMESPWRSCINGNAGGGIWNKIQNAQKRRQQQRQQSVGSDLDDSTATGSDTWSDHAAFWSRLETIRASGLLDDGSAVFDQF
jgi:serine/threonine protein kinase